MCLAVPAQERDNPTPEALALEHDGLNANIIRNAYEAISPAVGLLTYSSEITNAGTGEVTRRDGSALGLLVSNDGLVITHGHMQLPSRKPTNIKLTFGEGENEREYDATFLSKPEDVNVCFLRVESDDVADLPYVTFEKDTDLELGDPLLLIGVLSKSLDYTRSVLSRRIGAVLQSPRTTYALDQATPFGFIGGPAINVNGDVVGILGFDLTPAEGGDLYTRSGHPLIFQTSLLQEHIDNPPTNDTASDAPDAWLGIYTQPLTEDFANYWDVPNDGGIIVSTVLPQSPAERSGLRPGDVIVQFNDSPVTAKQDRDVANFTKMVRESPLGEVLTLHLYRSGEKMTVRLTLTDRPRSERDAREIEDTLFGLTVREITLDVRIAMNLSDDVQGVIVRRIKSGSPANLARMRPGIVILQFGGRPIANLEDFQNAVSELAKERPQEIPVFCRVGANTAFFRIQPRWDNERN
jgi:serine protease Do